MAQTNPNIEYLRPIPLRYSPDIEDGRQDIERSAARKVGKRVSHAGELVTQICMDYWEKSTGAQGYKHRRAIRAVKH